jgi:hypothetical protein
MIACSLKRARASAGGASACAAAGSRSGVGIVVAGGTGSLLLPPTICTRDEWRCPKRDWSGTGGPRTAETADCANWYSRARPQRSILPVMTCAYCGQQATMRIVSNAEHVCFEHGLEFWTGLLVYARDHSGACVKHERVCTCRSCEESSAASRRASAIAAAGPSPQYRERFPMRLAS